MSTLPLEVWSSRTFRFDFPVERLPVIVDRLRGAPDRVEAKLRGIAPETLARRDGPDWSMQEHVGHLRDLDVLHLKRLDEIARGAAELSAHDMTNRATWDANYNARRFGEVLAEFKALRATLVDRLSRWDAARVADSALHPRLKQPMRVVDVAFFAAEHDDHYIAVIESIRAKIAAAAPAR
ncbi:MAG: DinB family protein [Phycisphaerales bacterium]